MRRGAVALFAQGVNSLSNLMVGVFVARTLGPSALGRFAFLFTLLLTLVALQTQWVGDSLTVLNRERPLIRRGIANAQWMHVLLGVVVGGLIAYYVGGVGVASSVAFALLVAAWELEEFGRRMFMARLEFWKQGANDGSYLVITALCLGVWIMLAKISLTAVFGCMAVGALGAFLLGVAWLPQHERLRGLSPTLTGLLEVSRYGFWRGAQSGAAYLAHVTVRGLVIALASVSVMGQLEAARLIVAPLLTLSAALNNVTLASFARSVKSKHPVASPSLLKVLALGGGAVCVVYSAFVLAQPTSLTHLLTGGRFHPDRTALIGWLLLALAVALATPWTSLALVVARSSAVFCFMLFGSLVGVAFTATALVTANPSLMPTCLAAGTAVSGVMIWRLVRAANPQSPAAEEISQPESILNDADAPVTAQPQQAHIVR